eukprot:s696_g19.t1
MDTKWIPAAPLPEWKGWTSRARELSAFKGWLEKFASWLCLIHDSCAAGLKEALASPYPVQVVNADQAIRSRRLFHLIQQRCSGYPRVENVIKSQIAFYGIQAANGFELLRLLRREFSLMSRLEALHYREAALKYTVKKADKHLLLDVLRDVGAEIESFHAMLDASLIAHQLADLRLTEGDQFLLYNRNLPESDGVCATALRSNYGSCFVAVTEFYIRMRMTGDLERVHGIGGDAKGQPKGQGKGNTDSNTQWYNCGNKGHLAKDCRNPPKYKHCGKSGHLAQRLLGERSIQTTQNCSCPEGKSQVDSQEQRVRQGTWSLWKVQRSR